jgi:hypothetical protein
MSTPCLEGLIDTMGLLDYDVVCCDLAGDWKTRPVIVSLLTRRTTTPIIVCPPGRKERMGAHAALDVLGKIRRDDGSPALDAAMLVFIEGERGHVMDIRTVRQGSYAHYAVGLGHCCEVEGGRDGVVVGCTVRAVALRSSRKASLTAASVGNAAATSGARRTRLVPAAIRARYLPRTPSVSVVSSYSSRNSSSSGVCIPCCIESPFFWSRHSRTNDPDAITTISMSYKQKPTQIRCAENDPTIFRH